MLRPSKARATVVSEGVLNSIRAKDRSLEIWQEMQGSMPSITLRPLSWRLKKFIMLSSVAVGGRL